MQMRVAASNVVDADAGRRHARRQIRDVPDVPANVREASMPAPALSPVRARWQGHPLSLAEGWRERTLF